MFEFIQVTAQYSNTVLVVLLPFFSDFAEKVQLTASNPITPACVQQFVCSPTKADVGGYLTLTNGLELWYDHGHVRGFRTPRSSYHLQFAKDLSRFFAPVSLTKADCLALARRAIVEAGYTLTESFADQEPQVKAPMRFGTNLFPNYAFTWLDPVFGSPAVTIEVDASRGVIQELILQSKFFWRPPPKIPVEPQVLNAKPPITSDTSNAFVASVLPRISQYAKTLRLPIATPLARQSLDRVEFVDPPWVAMLRLTNGFWFDIEKQDVAGFTAPDATYTSKPTDRPVSVSQYFGKWNLDEKAAIDLVLRSIRTLGYRPEDFKADQSPAVTKRSRVGRYVVPRYFFHRIQKDNRTGEMLSLAEAEIDAGTRTLKYLYLTQARTEETNLNQTAPITNTPSGKQPHSEHSSTTNLPSRPRNTFE